MTQSKVDEHVGFTVMAVQGECLRDTGPEQGSTIWLEMGPDRYSQWRSNEPLRGDFASPEEALRALKDRRRPWWYNPDMETAQVVMIKNRWIHERTVVEAVLLGD